MNKTLEQSIPRTDNRSGYWVKLILAAIFSLFLALIVSVLWVSYQQAIDYLHPMRHTASGELLKANGIDFKDVELITEDNIKLSAWYTPSQNGVVILVAHGYGDKRAEDFYALFASHGYGVIAWDFRAHGKSEGNFSR